MRKPGKITVALADWQVEFLQPLFDKIRDDNVRGIAPGSVIAQVFPDGMRVGYLSAAKIGKMSECIKPGRKPSVRDGAFARAKPMPAAIKSGKDTFR